MTRDEAIYLLKQIYTGNPNDKVALHMAIEALEKATPRRREDDERTSNILINFGDIGSQTIKPLERKRGEWIDGLDIPKEERERYPYLYLHGEKYCSVCYKEAYYDTDYGQQLFDYCPNCGADMRGAEDVD